MSIFAVIEENNQVSNVIVANNQQIAETVTQKTCVLIDDNPSGAGIGWYYIDGIFVKNKPEEITPLEE